MALGPVPGGVHFQVVHASVEQSPTSELDVDVDVLPIEVGGIRAKLRRAQELLADHRVDAVAYIGSGALGAPVSVYDAAAGVHFIEWRQPNPLPDSFAVRAGEIVHQIRSTLDHIIGILVERNGGTRTRRTAFPVCSQADAWARIRDSAGTRPGPLDGLTKAQIEVVDAMQPLLPRGRTLGSASDLLSRLQELWNLDKHNDVAASSTASAAYRVSVPQGAAYWIDSAQGLVPLGAAVQDGTRLLRVVGAAPDGRYPVDAIFQAWVGIGISFGACQDPTPTAGAHELIAMLKMAVSVIDDLWSAWKGGSRSHQ